MVEQFRFSPEDEETIAGLVGSACYLSGELTSLPTAVALALLGEGYKRLRKASSDNRGEGSVTADIRQRAIDGLGLVLVGSLAWAVESAIGSSWDDNVYISAFNEHIRGAPLSTISADIKRGSRFNISSTADDTVRIQAINTNGTAETIELLSNNRWRLPSIVQAHLSSFDYEIQTTVFRKAARIFVETSKRLSQDPPQAEFTPERKLSFLENMDHIIAGGKNIKQEINDFLDELSRKVE